jgi:hypothetical protein
MPLFFTRPSDSLDMTFCDYVFPKLDFSLEVSHFESFENIWSIVTVTLKVLSENDLEQCF